MEKPNILIFMTDQQRGDTIPPYGRAKTPNLEKFCKEGVTFSNAYTIAPHCCPSRATFFSGLYPSQHGVWNNVNVANTLSKGLYEGIRLFSEDLYDDGYSTFFSGRWHVSSVQTPLDRGFEVMNFPKPTTKNVMKHIRPDDSIWENYIDVNKADKRGTAEIVRRGYKTYKQYGTKDSPYRDEQVVNDSINLIKKRKDEHKPWLHYIGVNGPHDAYFVPQEYLDMYDIAQISLPENFEDNLGDKPSLYRRTRDKFDQLSEYEHKESIRHYLALCTYEDFLFGRILKALDESDQTEDTLVIYLSDHGDYMAEHGLWCKGLPCFKGAYHIPTAIRWPKGIKNKGINIDEFITLADFAPTILEVAGIDVEREFAGKSFLPLLKEEKISNWPKEVYTQTNGNELYGIQRSVMTNDWKLVYNGFDYDELYDLKNDPYESTNIINESEYEKTIYELYKKLWKFAKKTNDTCINGYITVSLARYGPGIAFE